MSAFWELVRRDMRVAWKEGGAIGLALGFYLVVVAMLPLGLGPDLNLLSRIAPGVLWVALLLAALLSLGRPVMVGPSRKRFLGSVTGREVAERDTATAAACVVAYERGARLFRVHNVAMARDALAVAHAARGMA